MLNVLHKIVLFWSPPPLFFNDSSHWPHQRCRFLAVSQCELHCRANAWRKMRKSAVSRSTSGPSGPHWEVVWSCHLLSSIVNCSCGKDMKRWRWKDVTYVKAIESHTAWAHTTFQVFQSRPESQSAVPARATWSSGPISRVYCVFRANRKTWKVLISIAIILFLSWYSYLVPHC